MADTLFFELLTVIDPGKRGELEGFANLESNKLYAGDREMLGEMLSELEKNESASEADLMGKLFPHPKPNKEVDRRKSRLSSMMKRYLMLYEVEGSPIGQLLLLRLFSQHSLKRNSSKLLGTLARKEKGGKAGESLYRYLLSEMKVKRSKNKRQRARDLEEMENRLDVFYCENKLRLLFERISREVLFGGGAVPENLLEAVDEISKRAQSGYIAFCRTLVQLLHNPDWEAFEAAFRSLNENAGAMPLYQFRESSDHLMNFCIFKVNNSNGNENLPYVGKYLQIVGLLQSRKCFLEPGGLGVWKYKNCISMGLLAGKPAWAESFCGKYRTALYPRQLKRDAYRFNKARIALYNGQTELAARLMPDYRTSDLFHKTAIQKATAKIAFEQYCCDQYDKEALLAMLKNFKKQVGANKYVAEGDKERQLAFYEVLGKLVRGKEFDFGDVENRLSLLDRNWLVKHK